MDVLVRRRSLVLIALAACAPASGPPVGVSDGPRARPVPSASAHSAAPNPIASDFRSKYTKLTGRFPSAGHFVGRYDAVVWASADAAESWNKQTTFPEGARLVMEHLKRGADDVGPLLAMERRNGTWRWIMVTSDGNVLVDGDSNACAQCHGEAAKDSVFVIR